MKEYNPLMFDNGLNEAINNGNGLWLVKNPVAGDAINNNYAALDAKRVASVVLAGGDKSLSTYGTGNRQVTTAALTDSAADADSINGDDLHFAIVDTVNLRVLMITDETTDQVITTGNGVNLPVINWKLAQPV